MTEAFGSLYAEGYDFMYREKDYKAECDLLESIWAETGTRVKTVLDLGCGTGAHSLELAARGYEVTGVDISPEMIAIAERKKDEAGAVNVAYYVSDIADVDLGREFDAAIMMFNVIGYLADRDQRQAALTNVRKHLDAGSPFVFDFWYGPALLEDPPGQTFRQIPVDGGEILRAASTRFDVEKRVCDITISVWRIEGDRVAGRTSERHRVTFFFEDELASSLRRCGIELVRTAAFSDPQQALTGAEWNGIGICRATRETAAT